MKKLSGRLETERRLHEALMDQLPDHIYFKDAESRFTEVNAAMARFLGLTDPAQAVGKTDFDFFTSEHAGRAFADELDLVHERLAMISKEEKETRPDGRVTWVHTTKLPFRDESGRIIGTFGVSRDITERRLSEERLRILSAAVEQSPVGIFITDLQGIIEYANPKAAEMTGYSVQELIGQNPRILKSGETPAEEYRNLWETIPKGEWRGIFHNRKKNGELYWVSSAIRPIYDSSGAPIHYMGISQDITDRKRAEEAVRRSETKFRTIYDSTSDGLFLLDEGRITNCNRAALMMFGFSTNEEFCSNRPADISPPLQPCGTDSMTLADRYIAQATAKGHAHFEWVHKRLDTGEPFHAEVILHAMEIDGKRMLQAIVRNITERKHVEHALRESELKYRTLVTHLPQRIFYKDRHSAFVSCNDLFAKDHGIAADQISGKTDFDFVAPEMAEKFRADDRRVMEQGHTVELEEETVIGGHARVVSTVKTPVTNEDGEVVGILGMFTDITERKRAEEALRQTERQLRLAQKLESIGQLAAGIAHEINTPIQYIGDNARFLDQALRDLAPFIDSHQRIETALLNSPERELGEKLERILREVDVDYLRDEVPKAISQMSEGVEHVARIVRAMKEFSHPGPAEMTPVDLNRAIESTVLVSKNEWKYVADLTTRLDPDLPPVPCIGGEFNQVLLNLIVNAAHAIADVQKVTGEKGSIQISTCRNGKWAEIRVRDTGSGIPEEIQSRVFDPFFTTKGVGKGTGQGLAIAHGVIVQKHRGTLSFESQAGSGTTFLIQLPLELQEP